MKKKQYNNNTVILDNAFLINQKLRTSVVEFVAKLAEAEDRRGPRHHRKGIKTPSKGETPGAE